MKKINNVLFTLAMIGIICVVYFNVEEISSVVKRYLVNDNKPVIKNGNDYTRTYNYISFNYEEDYIPFSRQDIMNIYFNILNNGWETFTFYCPYEYNTCLYDVENIAFNNELLSKINNYVHPYNSFYHINTKVSSSGEVSVEVTHKYDKEKIAEINNKTNQIIKYLGLRDLTIKEKIAKIHDYIIKNSRYDNDATIGQSKYDSTSAYGNLIEGYSVCSGYSDAMAIFLDILNVPNLKISSNNHIWNLVYIDGKWLHLDLTWDDTDNEKYNNNYFLITKEKLFTLDSKEHSFDEDFFLEGI